MYPVVNIILRKDHLFPAYEHPVYDRWFVASCTFSSYVIHNITEEVEDLFTTLYYTNITMCIHNHKEHGNSISYNGMIQTKTL